MKPMEPMKPLQPMEAPEAWWPRDLGQPASSGGQNDLQYAYFADANRLAIRHGGKVTLYDTGDHRISGVSQGHEPHGESGPAFTSQHGAVQLHDLKQVGH